MSISGLPHSIQAHSRPQAKDMGRLSADSSEPASCNRLRRSWYSQTFEDDEGDDEWEKERASSSMSAASVQGPFLPAQESRLDSRALGIPRSPLTTCQNGDTVSEASTDVGSDDEGYGKRLGDLDTDTRQQLTSDPQQSVHKAEPGLHCDTLADIQSESSAALKELSAEELEEMRQRRFQKRQRQRQQRREQRVQERAQRSDRRRRS